MRMSVAGYKVRGASLLAAAALSASCGQTKSSKIGDEPDSAATSDTFFVTGTLGGVERYAPYAIPAVMPGVVVLNALTEPDGASPQWYVYVELPTGPAPSTWSCMSDAYYVSFLEGNGTQYSGRATNVCDFVFESITADAWEGTFTARLLFTGSMQEVDLTDGRFRLPRAE